MGGVSCLIAVAFGIFWTVLAITLTRDFPVPMVGWVFPLFGVLFVIAGLVGAVYNFLNATTRNRLSMVDITSPKEEPDPLNVRFGGQKDPQVSIEERLAKIEELRKNGTISETEFVEQRQRILAEI